MSKAPAFILVYAAAWMALTIPALFAGAGLPLSAGRTIGVLLCAHALLGLAVWAHLGAPKQGTKPSA